MQSEISISHVLAWGIRKRICSCLLSFSDAQNEILSWGVQSTPGPCWVLRAGGSGCFSITAQGSGALAHKRVTGFGLTGEFTVCHGFRVC